MVKLIILYARLCYLLTITLIHQNLHISNYCTVQLQLDNTRCCVYSFEFLMMGGGTA
jgi:hypothetical protein